MAITHLLQLASLHISDGQGLGDPPGVKGQGQQGKGQGRDFKTLNKPLPS